MTRCSNSIAQAAYLREGIHDDGQQEVEQHYEHSPYTTNHLPSQAV